ncbi:putative delta-60 repeat protein [Pseudomonas laurylsulfativorans]|uniref:hypothetical protein n=1 Tax=Pseudomonas laurylsulfativorans TaxID=1943631 RepID=UPI0020A06731|nr:hypothetical protein [Pseudomonas laurylsulfativorans]MCP1420289.1 putative delta-60 repeat protein [Pseudomonas laurylsulfativorans]
MATQNTTSVAQPGELDPSFATGGKFVVPTPTDQAVSLMADSETLTLAMNAPPQFCLCRVDENGNLDTGFANQGWLKWRFDDRGSSNAYRALLQPDKKILVIGSTYSSGISLPALTRLNANGSPDLVFGRVILQVFPASQTGITRISGCLQPDGKILVCGGYFMVGGGKTLLIRLSADGKLDPSFGIDGVVELSHSSGSLRVTQVAVQSSGRILVAGTLAAQGFVVGVGADGKVDVSFGEQGFVLVGAQGASYSFSNLLILGDGHLRCVGGTNTDFVSLGALLVGLDEDGNPDPSFNGGQPVVTKELLGQWVSVREQADRKLLVVGHSGGGGIEQVCSRFSPEGAIDRGFGWSGFMYHPQGPADSVIQSNGRWVTTANSSITTSCALYGRLI